MAYWKQCRKKRLWFITKRYLCVWNGYGKRRKSSVYPCSWPTSEPGTLYFSITNQWTTTFGHLPTYYNEITYEEGGKQRDNSIFTLKFNHMHGPGYIFIHESKADFAITSLVLSECRSKIRCPWKSKNYVCHGGCSWCIYHFPLRSTCIAPLTLLDFVNPVYLFTCKNKKFIFVKYFPLFRYFLSLRSKYS
jgi:hypothetical protein